MELWLRSQNKESLVKVNEKVYIMNYGDEYFAPIFVDDLQVASYKTKERALEVLDEIEGLLLLKQGLKLTTDAIFSVENNLAIYQMPKE